MTQSGPPPNTQTWLRLVVGCFFALLTGFFFGLPALSPLVGVAGIIIAIAYSGAVCLVGQAFIWVAIGLVTVLTIAYVIWTRSDFSVINLAVWYMLNLNFLVFGLLGVSLRKTLSVQKSWWRTAGPFAGSLGTGWLFSQLVSR
jgi:uncharacterized membrane protein